MISCHFIVNTKTFVNCQDVTNDDLPIFIDVIEVADHTVSELHLSKLTTVLIKYADIPNTILN